MGAKFKIGDRVRALRSCGAGGFVAGGVYIVKHAYFEGAHHRISVEVDSVGSTTNGWIAENFELLPVAANAQPAPLTIQAGAYYRTRDGRKVGPMDGPSQWLGQWFDRSVSVSSQGWFSNGAFIEGCNSPLDLIAEWVDEPINLREEVESGRMSVDEARAHVGLDPAAVAGSNENGTPKFRGGDRVRDISYENLLATVVAAQGDKVGVHYDGDPAPSKPIMFPAADYVLVETSQSPTTGFTVPHFDDEDVGPDSKLVVSISADTNALDAEIDRVLRRLKKLKKKARKLGVNLEYSELLSAA